MAAARKAFTLMELIVVMVVIGILAAIGIAKFVNTKEEAYIASMKADLRNLAIYQMNHQVEQSAFFSGDGTAQGFKPTTGVTVVAVASPGPPPSWEATATHTNTAKTCRIVTTGPRIWEISCL